MSNANREMREMREAWAEGERKAAQLRAEGKMAPVSATRKSECCQAPVLFNATKKAFCTKCGRPG